jgi:nucleoside-diphosphate-sugar epimerase
LRLGYLYGPASRDLKAYRLAFRLGRPYWAGPARSRQYFLHHDDAARALLLAARQRPEGRVVYASDDKPVAFRTFMDHFAHLVGNPLPLHIPRFARQLSMFVVAEEHKQMVEIGMRGEARPRPRGFKPMYPTYRSGLRQVIDAWGDG